MDTETTAHSLSWIKRIPGELFALDEKPLLGSPPPFPLEEFARLLSEAFQIKNVQFSIEKWQWRTREQLFDGYGDKLKITGLNIAPIEGNLWWMMSQLDFSRMMAHILSVDGLDTVDPELNEALSTFFAIQLMDVFGRCGFDKKLSLQILSDTPQPSTECLTLDIETTIQDKTFPSRLLLSPPFRQSWKQRYLQEEKRLMLESPLADSLEVEIHVEAGRLNISIEEWNQLQDGDFVVLESCSLDPEESKGRVMLVINGTPFFRAKLKQGSLKILEYPLYYEVPSMNTPTDDKKNDEDDFEDEFNDIETDEEEEGEEEQSDETGNDGVSAQKESPKGAEKKEEEFDEDFDIEDDETDEEEETSELEATEPEQPIAKVEKEKAPALPKKPTSLEDVPLCVVLEVGRIQMSVKKLLELQPGNMLELDIHPEAGVDMVVNGRKVARGELLKIGDAIGVRISERM